jgi:pyruvate formate lyase activating enzyme
MNKLKESLYYEKLSNKLVKCKLCPHNCTIQKNSTGICKTRKNIDGKLYSLNYGKPISISIDPIEKKPLYKFHPGKKILSIGTLGCNFSCKFCQNYEISQIKNLEQFKKQKYYSPEEIIKLTQKNNLNLIAFTYTEPTVFYEYMLDIAKLAKQNNIECVIVSNGFINPQPLQELCKYIHAANIDFKSFDNEFYKKICNGKLNPVLKTLKILNQNKIHIEITNLLIANYNDNLEELENLAKWIKNNLGKKIVLHLSRAFPMYKMQEIKITPIKKMLAAKKTCEKHLTNVFLGNI